MSGKKYLKYMYLTCISDLYPQYINNSYNSISRPKSVYKFGKRFKHLTKQNIQLVNKHMQGCLLLFLIRKINTKMINYYRLIRMTEMKKPSNTTCQQGCGGIGILRH